MFLFISPSRFRLESIFIKQIRMNNTYGEEENNENNY